MTLFNDYDYHNDDTHLALAKYYINTNGRHFSDDICKSIFLNENIRISITISLKFVPNDPINNIPTLVQIMAWRRPGDKQLSESMRICLTDAYMRHPASMS